MNDSEETVVLHQCSLSLHCKSTTCDHAKPHEPEGCNTAAPCGCWPGNKFFRPRVQCIHVADVKPAEHCPDCGKPGSKGHHPGDCIAFLKRDRSKAYARFHEIMALLRDMDMPHGLCQPRESKACTHCNAKDVLDQIRKEYKGPPITTVNT